jgi:predicted dehydrogenase
MRILIVGLGSIGRRHLTNLRLLEPDAHITVWRQYSRGDAGLENLENVHVVYSETEALERKPHVAFITGPASTHIPTAFLLAREGISLFIEKPLSSDMVGVNELIAVCREKRLTLMVGYNLRFNEGLRRMKEALAEGAIGRLLAFRAEAGMYLPDWRVGTDYKAGVSGRRELGGGAALELSHELDYARWLGGEIKALCARTARASDLDIDVEDLAEVIVEFDNGAIGNIHIDMIQRAPVRQCRLIGSTGTLLWDGIRNEARLYSANGASWTRLWDTHEADRNQTYVAEAAHFLECFKSQRDPLIPGEDGAQSLALALAVKRSSELGKWVSP